MNDFCTVLSIDKHFANCICYNEVKRGIPWIEENKWAEYQNGKNQFRVSFTFYAAFEGLLKPFKAEEKHEKETEEIGGVLEEI